MNSLNLFGLCSIVIAFFSCTAVKLPLQTSINRIDTLLILDPVSTIGVIYKGNEVVYDSILSEQSKNNLKSGIKDYIPQRIKVIQIEFDTATQIKIDTTIFSFFLKTENKRKQDTLQFPKLLDSILTKNYIDYALCLFQNGYIRTNENYDKQLLKTLGIYAGTALFSLGLFAYTGSTIFINQSLAKSGSFLSGCIIDNQHKNVVYIKRSIKPVLEEKWDPTDKKMTDKQIKEIFDEYIFKEQLYYKYGH